MTANESGLHLLVAVAFRRRSLLLIALWALFAGLAAYAASFLFEPRYAATVVVTPAASGDSTSGLARLAGSFGGLAGIDDAALFGAGDQSVAQELLQSRAILRELIERYQLMPVLFAESWDEATGQWSVRWWKRVPTTSDAIDLLDRKVRRLVVDRQTGALRVTIRWRDPQAAALWANSIVELVNSRARDAAILEAEKSVELLAREAESTSKVQLQTEIFNLIASHVRSMTVARSRDNYALRVLDPAVPADASDYVFPDRLLMVVSATVFAVFAVLFWLLIGENSRRSP